MMCNINSLDTEAYPITVPLIVDVDVMNGYFAISSPETHRKRVKN